MWIAPFVNYTINFIYLHFISYLYRSFMDGMMKLFSKISIKFLKPSISVPYQVPCQSFEASAPQFKTLLRNLMMAKMGNKEPDSDDSWIIGLVSAQTRMCLNQTLVCVTLPSPKMFFFSTWFGNIPGKSLSWYVEIFCVLFEVIFGELNSGQRSCKDSLWGVGHCS